MALAVDGGEAVEGADQDYQVGCGEQEAGPEGFGGWWDEGGVCAVEECAVAGVEGAVCCVVVVGSWCIRFFAVVSFYRSFCLGCAPGVRLLLVY